MKYEIPEWLQEELGRKRERRWKRAIVEATLLLILCLTVAFIVSMTIHAITVEANTVIYKAVEAPVVKEEKISTAQILDKISECESERRHYDEEGKVLRGEIDHRDVGKWQINEYWWLEKSEELGIDIYTEEGNKEMALWILTKTPKGVDHWSKSYDPVSHECWKNKKIVRNGN